jgi:hypothetical protein
VCSQTFLIWLEFSCDSVRLNSAFNRATGISTAAQLPLAQELQAGQSYIAKLSGKFKRNDYSSRHAPMQSPASSGPGRADQVVLPWTVQAISSMQPVARLDMIQQHHGLH